MTVFDKPDAALDEALDDVERKLNVDFNRLAARDAIFPDLVGALKACRDLMETQASRAGINLKAICPSLSGVIAEAEKLL